MTAPTPPEASTGDDPPLATDPPPSDKAVEPASHGCSASPIPAAVHNVQNLALATTHAAAPFQKPKVTMASMHPPLPTRSWRRGENGHVAPGLERGDSPIAPRRLSYMKSPDMTSWSRRPPMTTSQPPPSTRQSLALIPVRHRTRSHMRIQDANDLSNVNWLDISLFLSEYDILYARSGK